MIDKPFLRRVVIQNYKSIASCDVPLGPLTFLVGLNGSGKSNFVDALRFCRDGLKKSIGEAFTDRGHLRSLSHRPGNGPPHFGIRVELALPGGRDGHYSFSLRTKHGLDFTVEREECLITDSSGDIEGSFSVNAGSLQGNIPAMPEASDSQLFLRAASWIPGFNLVYEALSSMEFYNPYPEALKGLDRSGSGEVLESSGRNAASVLSRLETENPDSKARIDEYIRRIVPGLEHVKTETFRTSRVLTFEQAGRPGLWTEEFEAGAMSDGTLRSLAILIALFQFRQDRRHSLIAIEEPETGLHPAAVGILFDALREGSNSAQILVTSHSADLLDNREIPTDSILAVDASAGSTRIGRVDRVGRSTLQDRLYTAGELLRMDQLRPDPKTEETAPAETALFDGS